MNMLKTSLLTAAMLGSVMMGTAQTADEIMAKHAQAVGGDANWNKIQTLKLNGSMNQGGVDISITQTLAVGKAMRIDISAMGMSGFQIVTTSTGWMYMPFLGTDKLDTMKPDMVKTMQRQLDVKGAQMLDYKSNGSKQEYAGRDTISNAPCYKVKITDKEGSESVCYFDCATYYLVRTETTVKQDDQEQEVAVIYGNHKKQDEGIVLPMSVTAQGAEITFKSIDVNKPVDESVFKPAMPGKTEQK